MFYAPSPNRRKHWYRVLSIGQKKLIVLAMGIGVVLIALLSVLGVYTYRSMEYDLERVVRDSGTSMLYDLANQPIAALSGEETRPVRWEELPPHLVEAFVAREDDDFFSHSGVVFSSVLRSVLSNLASMRYKQGASTITMQLTRHVYELHGKSLDRKLLEAVLAQRIERRYDKRTIMEQYLSRIFYGQNCYGLRAAAGYYFGKEVNQLSLAESATLAGLVRAPSLCNPVRSMEAAMAVKRETLERMLECDYITPVEFEAAVAAPLELRKAVRMAENPSYAVMWSRRELDAIRSEIAENSGGVSVVSTLRLPIQQYLEQAVETALASVENPAQYPEAWLNLEEKAKADLEELQRTYVRMRRPATLKVRGADNELSGLLQCCALVVDTRHETKGQVLAVVGGRSVADGRDRWLDRVKPGKAFAPFLFCRACMPGGKDMHIESRSMEVTGMRMGYDVVRSFYDTLKLEAKLPSRRQEKDLYNGLFPVQKLELARMLFSLVNQGKGYRLSIINSVWNRDKQLIYANEPGKAPEYILRESAVAVSKLPPFVVQEKGTLTLDVSLPEQGGQWALIRRDKAVCVLVWMGFDDSASPAAKAKEMQPLLVKAAANLAHEVFDRARAELRKEMAREKEMKKQAQQSAA